MSELLQFADQNVSKTRIASRSKHVLIRSALIHVLDIALSMLFAVLPITLPIANVHLDIPVTQCSIVNALVRSRRLMQVFGLITILFPNRRNTTARWYESMLPITLWPQFTVYEYQ